MARASSGLAGPTRLIDTTGTPLPAIRPSALAMASALPPPGRVGAIDVGNVDVRGARSAQ